MPRPISSCRAWPSRLARHPSEGAVAVGSRPPPDCVAPAKPSLDLLRSLTDEHVLRALMEQRRLTRAELAARTGISKPTVSESVRRLCAAGLVTDTGERTTGRGRVGSYYALTEGTGCALVVSVAPEGIIAETLDAHGQVLARATEQVERPAQPAQVGHALQTAARGAKQQPRRRARLAVVSAADPVDRATGRLVHLPDAPFLLGELSPQDVLAGLVDGPVLVDNDVNWAARAERAAGGRTTRRLRLHPSGRGPGLRPRQRRSRPPWAHRPRRGDRPCAHHRPPGPGRPAHRRLRRARSAPTGIDRHRHRRTAVMNLRIVEPRQSFHVVASARWTAAGADPAAGGGR
jgi:DNA-binding Lrp family transcriptional regulator